MSDFTHYYLAAFEVVFGVFILWQAPNFGALRPMFARELKDGEFGDRFCAVISRREEIENRQAFPWRMVGALTVVIGMLVFARYIDAFVAYAILCLAISSASAYSLLHLRNQTARRAASLAPRETTYSIPRWVFGLSIFVALTPLTFLTNPNVRVVAALVSLVGASMIAISAFVADHMAAILTGVDTEIEMIVEDRVRRSRIYGILGLGMAASFVFMGLMLGTGHVKPYQAFAQVLAGLSGLAIWTWNMTWFTRKVKPTHDNVHVV